MKRIGVRELRQRASEVLRLVAGGETFEVTARGRPVALLVPILARGLAALEAQGRLRPGEGDLLELAPLPLTEGATPPSAVISAGREE